MRVSALRRLSLVAVLAGLVSVCGLPAAGASSSGPPYQDANAHGYIGLCDRAGHQITHGSINTTPFAWRAISSVAAQPPYNGAGRTATLYAYQPRQGLPAGDWSGDQLTASSRYTDPAHPMAAATGGDESLKGFIGDFRPQWQGFLELRIYLGVPQNAIDSLTYPALNIKVTGSRWRAVGGGPVSCSSAGHSESLESIVLPKSDTKVRHHKGSRGSAVSGTGDQSHGKAVASATPSADPSAVARHAQSSSSPVAAIGSGGSGGGVSGGLIVAVVAIVIALGGAGLLFRRRSRDSA